VRGARSPRNGARATALRRLLVRRAPRDLERLRELVAGETRTSETAPA
jgi:hypothetical protein